MRRFYALMLAMVLILSSFVFSACSNKDAGTDTGNGTTSEEMQHNDNGNTTDNKVDDTNMNDGDTIDGNNSTDNADGSKNIVEEFGDDVERTVDDVVDAGQR